MVLLAKIVIDYALCGYFRDCKSRCTQDQNYVWGKSSFKCSEKYLDLDVSDGFIQVHRSVYLLTEAGRDFLRQNSAFSKALWEGTRAK